MEKSVQSTDRLTREDYESYQIVRGNAGKSKVFFTCEHASNRLPSRWQWPVEDEWIQNDHCAWEPGAADLSCELAEACEATAVLARFTRLLVDANRPLGSWNMFRNIADGRPVHLNIGLTPDAQQPRIERYYAPYHLALTDEVEAIAPDLVVGVHSFTPLYEGTLREVEIGILFSDDLRLGDEWTAFIAANSDFVVRANEPYSGAAGMMYSPHTHAVRGGACAIELEIRQDLLCVPEIRAKIASLVQRAIYEIPLKP